MVVESPAEIAEKPMTPRVELSLEISRLVSRVLAGETIDKTLCGVELSARFPESGMSPKMIAEAIDRAAGMVGLIREGGIVEVAPTGVAEAAAAETGDLLDEDGLAAAIGAELEELVAQRRAGAPDAGATASTDDVVGQARASDAPQRLGGLVGAVRRVFSRG